MSEYFIKIGGNPLVETGRDQYECLCPVEGCGWHFVGGYFVSEEGWSGCYVAAWLDDGRINLDSWESQTAFKVRALCFLEEHVKTKHADMSGIIFVCDLCGEEEVEVEVSGGNFCSQCYSDYRKNGFDNIR